MIVGMCRIRTVLKLLAFVPALDPFDLPGLICKPITLATLTVVFRTSTPAPRDGDGEPTLHHIPGR